MSLAVAAQAVESWFLTGWQRHSACAKRVGPNLKDVVSAGAALIATGDAEGALKRCAAVLVLRPTDKEANTCVTTARTQIAAHDRDRLKLEQARGFFAAGEHARASQTLDELGKSEFPDILDGIRRTAG